MNENTFIQYLYISRTTRFHHSTIPINSSVKSNRRNNCQERVQLAIRFHLIQSSKRHGERGKTNDDESSSSTIVQLDRRAKTHQRRAAAYFAIISW